MPRGGKSKTGVELLAMRICWLEFGIAIGDQPTAKKRIGATEAQYWKSLPPETRAKFVEEAHRFVWLEERLAGNTTSLNILDRARHEMAVQAQKAPS